MRPYSLARPPLKERIERSKGWIAERWKKLEVEVGDENFSLASSTKTYAEIFYSIPGEDIFRRSHLKGTEKFEVLKRKLRWKQKNGRCTQIRSLETDHLFNILKSAKVHADDLSCDVIKAVLKDRVNGGKIPLEEALVCPVEEVRLAAALVVQRENNSAASVKIQTKDSFVPGQYSKSIPFNFLNAAGESSC